jgi:carbon monoxide dehydrogenase subunit G
MLIETGFSLSAAPGDAWALLTDLERVAPAMPGVTVTSVGDDELQATMRVKVGPVTAAYRTTVAFAQRDEAAGTAVLKASGRETRGTGTVDATVTATLTPDGTGTAVALSTDVAITGKIAQFGGSVISEVADKLLRQFAAELERQLATPPTAGLENQRATPATAAAPAAGGAGAAAPRPRPAPPTSPAEPIDLGRLAGGALLPQAQPTIIALLLGVIIGLLLGRRR